MRDLIHRVRNERGFTLSELLVVMLILGGLSAIAVLSIVRFLGSGTAEAANTEVHNAHAAIANCISEAGAGQLDTDVAVNWNGSDDIVTATNAAGTVYDAADSLRGKRLKATYTVTPGGEITGVTDQEWKGVTWEDGRWKKDKKDKK